MCTNRNPKQLEASFPIRESAVVYRLQLREYHTIRYKTSSFPLRLDLDESYGAEEGVGFSTEVS